MNKKYYIFFISIIAGLILFNTRPVSANLSNSCLSEGMYESVFNISPDSGPVDQVINVEVAFRWSETSLPVCTDTELLFTVELETETVADEEEVGKGSPGEWITKNFKVNPSTLGFSSKRTKINFRFLVEEDGFFVNENIVSLVKTYTVGEKAAGSNKEDSGGSTKVRDKNDVSDGSTKEQFNLEPPEGTPRTIDALVESIANFILTISIPIAVILIIVAGVIFLISAGNAARVGKARKILWYTVIGLVILLIGRGFISLIISILGGSTP